jgi:hypothetical protein
MLDIRHNANAQRFEIALDGHVAELTYRIDGYRIIFTHTAVPTTFQGRGIAGALVKAGLEYAQEQKLKVIPICSFVADYLKRHPQYKSLESSCSEVI